MATEIKTLAQMMKLASYRLKQCNPWRATWEKIQLNKQINKLTRVRNHLKKSKKQFNPTQTRVSVIKEQNNLCCEVWPGRRQPGHFWTWPGCGSKQIACEQQQCLAILNHKFPWLLFWEWNDEDRVLWGNVQACPIPHRLLPSRGVHAASAQNKELDATW